MGPRFPIWPGSEAGVGDGFAGENQVGSRQVLSQTQAQRSQSTELLGRGDCLPRTGLRTCKHSESCVAISLYIFARKKRLIWNDLPTYYKSRDIQNRLGGATETYRKPGAIKINNFQCPHSKACKVNSRREQMKLTHFSRGYRSREYNAQLFSSLNIEPR